MDYIVRKNILVGDMLNGVEKIRLTEFTLPKTYKFRQSVFRLSDLLRAQHSNWAPPSSY